MAGVEPAGNDPASKNSSFTKSVLNFWSDVYGVSLSARETG